jgi:hypothetical protein
MHTNTHALPARDTGKHCSATRMKMHDQRSKHANKHSSLKEHTHTCSALKEHAHTRSALDTGNSMMGHAQLLKHANKTSRDKLWTAAFDTCRNVCTLALLSTQTMEMQIHTHPSVKANRCKARSAFTSRHVHKHAKLWIRAYTRRPSMRACTCIK